MNGTGVIVMRISNGGSDNGHRYHEHASLQSAKAEAHRLAATIDGDFVVYVPVAVIRKTPPTIAELVQIPDCRVDINDELPF